MSAYSSASSPPVGCYHISQQQQSRDRSSAFSSSSISSSSSSSLACICSYLLRMWKQVTFSLPAKRKGCHLITDEIRKRCPFIQTFEVGLCHVYIQHTSASLTINENADPTVRSDMERALDRIAPESACYDHDDEGPDDMPAHIKSSVLGASVSIPITAGELALGTWQGVWLCEHRQSGGTRSFVVTAQGMPRAGSK